MTYDFDVQISELGVDAAAAIEDLFKRSLGGRPIIEYAYGTPAGWDDIAEGGWDLVGAAEEDGGAGLGIRDLIALAMVVGRWVPPLPLLESIMAKRWSSVARETDGPVTVAIRTESGRVLVPFGETPGISLLVDASPTVGALAEPVIVAADDYAPSLRLAESDRASAISAEQARELAVVWGAEAAGCARRALEIAVDYVKQRNQFGQPVGRFQAVKHHLANALMSSQESESAVLWAASDAPKLAPALEIVFDSALRTAEIATQAHGGMGFTWDLGLHVYLRQIVALRQLAMSLAAVVDAG
jgi:alkylation response protein AidB-like acyl-CoA dehydrogenase